MGLLINIYRYMYIHNYHVLFNFKADILVNSVGTRDPTMQKAGAICKAFLDLGGPELQSVG